MLLTRTVAPVDLISAADLKAHLRIDHTYEDAALDALRAAVAEHLDGRNGFLGRALVTQTWRMDLPFFPTGTMLFFPMPPLQSVTSIQYYDVDNALQTVNPATYYVVPQAHVGYVKLGLNQFWPAAYDRDDAVRVTFVAGYGAASAVPTPIRQAALLLAGHMYANRGDARPDNADSAMTDAARRLLTPYRLQEFMSSNEQRWRETRAPEIC